MRLRKSLHRAGIAALSFALVSALTACSERTSILVRVVSPLAIPADIDRIEFDVRGETTGAVIERDFDLTTDWPHTILLRPGPSEADELQVTLTARQGGAFVMRRVVRARFVRGSEQVVEIELAPDCRSVVCAEGIDCIGGRCENEQSPDAGLPDAARPDGGIPPDGNDGGGGCAIDSDCADEIDCTLDSCIDGMCSNTPDDAVCVEGTQCDPVVGCPLRTCTQDRQCADNRVCNGAEICGGDMTCAAGTPMTCDDGDSCTADRCNEALRGECDHTTLDADGDLHGDSACAVVGGVVNDDCNDANAEVLPGAPEVCNGLDDDCEGGCDEGFTCCRGTSGECSTTCGTLGSRTCSATCSWTVCSPPAEQCNAIDDDCNGAADDVFACVRGASRACTTACGSAGMQSCDAACSWGACVSPSESCNGADDDCDGVRDNGFTCIAGASTACTTGCGTTGARACTASCTLDPCVPPAEGCNGVDDDCDTRIDESVECTLGASGACTTSCGSSGNRTCSATCTWGTCAAPAESCNGSDDDCDGRVDEAFTCIPGVVGACTTGCGTTGSRTCSAACTWGSCSAPVEACNGRDDDCDTMCDETFSCCAGGTGTCTTSCGTTGSRTCSATCGWSACSPPADVCNGIDDDCNGACDDGSTCCAGRTGTCTTACGSTGSRTCSASCAWGSCTPPAEACGTGDDDCDGMVDEGFACSTGATQTCSTTCGTTGTRSCSATCAWNACTPPAEACNGLDDNCNASVDEGCGTCIGCAGAIAITGEGGRYYAALQPHAHTGSCGGSGSEYTLTFTTTAVRDVFITTHAANVDTVVYVRRCACAGTEVGCNDNANGRTTSLLRLTNLAAGTYQIFVDTKAAMSATLPVDVYLSAPGTESDRCGNVSFISAGTDTLTGDTCGFTHDYDLVGVTDCSYSSAGNAEERVYAFRLNSEQDLWIDGCTSGSDHDQSVYIRSVCTDGSLGAQLACNDDGDDCYGSNCPGSWRSQLSVTLPAGLYYLFIDGYAAGDCDCGDYEFDLSGF